MSSDLWGRTIRTLTAALASAAIFALGPIVSICQTVDAGGCVKALGSWPDAFLQLALPAVGTGLITLLGNFTEDKTGVPILGPRKKTQIVG